PWIPTALDSARRPEYATARPNILATDSAPNAEAPTHAGDLRHRSRLGPHPPPAHDRDRVHRVRVWKVGGGGGRDDGGIRQGGHSGPWDRRALHHDPGTWRWNSPLPRPLHAG